MTSLRAVLAEAGKLVMPSAKEEASLQKTAKMMLERVEAAAGRFKEVHGVYLGGSFAKGTWLPHDVDLDIFVRIAEDVDGPDFERIGLAVGEEGVRGYPHGKKYAQHPYTEASVGDVKVNIVPCYDVKPGKWKSAADRSLFHVDFVKEKMGAREKRQVRLLKRFMKTVGVYGAEIEIEGFSGYASEVLVYSHGDFEGVLSYFTRLKFGEEKFMTLKDPVDAERELATAISNETVARMMLASRAFLEAPGLVYFKKVKGKVRRALGRRLYCIRFDHAPLSEDTLWGELKKSTRQLVKYVEGQGFVIARSSAISDGAEKSAIVLLPEFDELPDLVERSGPSVDLADEVKRFVQKNKDTAELIWASGDGKVHMLQKRRFTGLGRLLEQLCAGEIEGIGTSRDVTVSIKRTGRVLTGRGIARERQREKWFGAGLDSIVTDNIGTDSS